MSYQVKCPGCGGVFDWKQGKQGIDWEKIGRRYWHKKCLEEENDKNSDIWLDKTYEILSKDLKVSYNFYQCKEQLDKAISKYGFTKKGIYLTTKYYLLIKNNKWDKNFGFWFIPKIYEEAKHFEEEKYNKEKIIKIENEFNLIKNYKPKQGIKQTVRKKEKNIPTLADAFKDENE